MQEESFIDSVKENSPIQLIRDALLEERRVQLFVKRDDLIHPQISGNKWRKLKYNLIAAKKQQHNQIITFGGAFSNHIYATAAAGKLAGIKTIGIIRGERIKPLNPTLQFAEEMGMQLAFVSRADYREKYSLTFQKHLLDKFGPFYFVPEGGTNELAIKGCTEIVKEVEAKLEQSPDYYCAACGTGGTLSGLIMGLEGRKKVLGFSVLKGDFHKKEIAQLIEQYQSYKQCKFPITFAKDWKVHTNYHFGGYAKYKAELIDFINEFKKEKGIQLDPIYTGKLFFGIFDLIKKEYFPKGSTILALHSGGLQGIEGFNQRFGDLIID
jgi:1-aminocyclopropane-1-carboxylate deaminase/D-cysteine desulfhydrase-like pyridoxal-dependent ACC family enzyme